MHKNLKILFVFLTTTLIAIFLFLIVSKINSKSSESESVEKPDESFLIYTYPSAKVRIIVIENDTESLEVSEGSVSGIMERTFENYSDLSEEELLETIIKDLNFLEVKYKDLSIEKFNSLE